MGLFKVQVTVSFYVMAESIQRAAFDGASTAKEALRDGGADVDVNAWLTTNAKKVPEAWLGSLPYRGDGKTTIRELLAAPPPGDATPGEEQP